LEDLLSLWKKSNNNNTEKNAGTSEENYKTELSQHILLWVTPLGKHVTLSENGLF
jgi:hypothetical protein